MRPMPQPTLTGDPITSGMFGGNFLADRYAVGEDGSFEGAVEELGVTGLRYPGGSLTERLFDIRTPDADRATEEDGTMVAFEPLSDFMAYAEDAGQPVTIVIPTRNFLSKNGDANGDRWPAFNEEELRTFVRDVAEGKYGDAQVDAFEIGNEYWGSGEMTAVEYGRLSSKMAKVIDEELQQVSEETGRADDIDIVVQTGTNFGSSDLRAQYEGTSPDDALADLNDRYDADFGDEVRFQNGSLNWRRINDELVQREFNAEEMEAIDGVVTHLYSKDPVQPGQREFGLDTIQNTWIDDAPDLDIYVTEWNQSAAEPRFDSDADFGLVKAHEVLNTFETMVDAGVDQANIWPLLQNTRNALQPDNLDGELSPTGALFSMMSDALPGKQMLDFAVDDRDATEFQGRTADLHGFYGDGELVFYLVSTSDQTETLSFDLDGLVAGGGQVTGTILGVAEGDAPGSTRARAETEDLAAQEFYDDGLIAITLDPGEIMEVRITEFEPTDDLSEAVSGRASPPIARIEDEPRDDMIADALIENMNEDPDPEPSDDDDDDDDGILDGLGWLLGILPVLALAGLAG